MNDKAKNDKVTMPPGFRKEPLPAVIDKAKEAALDLPERWDRRGDMITQFGEHIALRWRIAEMIAKSGMVRERKPEAIMAIQLKAYEMGLPLMQALAGMYFADGNVGIEGHLMDALAIERCGVTKKVHENSTRKCSMTLYRDGWEPLDVEYTIKDAIRAGLVQDFREDGTVVSRKTNWQKHPEEMLYWRALSKGLKRIAPDYFGGVYTLDEMEEAVGMQQRAGQSGANDELDALLHGRDVSDLEPLTEEEMEQFRDELNSAVDAGAINDEEREWAMGLMIAGKWAETREAWEEVRRAVLEGLEGPTRITTEGAGEPQAEDMGEDGQESLL